MSPRRRSIADVTVRHWFRHVCPSFENKWKMYLARRIHATVLHMCDGPSMCPSVTVAEWFSTWFPSDVPTNLKLISRKCYLTRKKTISIGLPPNKRLAPWLKTLDNSDFIKMVCLDYFICWFSMPGIGFYSSSIYLKPHILFGFLLNCSMRE